MIVDDMTVVDLPEDIGAFDGLQRNQKVFVLHTVAKALLCQDEVPPQLTASIEAAVATVFDRARAMVSWECKGEFEASNDDFPEAPSWRELVRTACRETRIWDDVSDIDEDKAGDWDLLLECLEGRVLWDRDWEMEEQLDADPKATRRVKRELGIDDDYYVNVPPDPTDEEAEGLLVELHNLTAEAR
ncbi:MAG: hypothetical protein ACC628_22760 [Pirellulaceae bacterium]